MPNSGVPREARFRLWKFKISLQRQYPRRRECKLDMRRPIPFNRRPLKKLRVEIYGQA